MSNPIFKFETAQRVKSKASILIEGLSGSGKSGLALCLAYGLTKKQWNKVFALDTENKSLQLFANNPTSVGGNFGEFQIGKLTSDVGYKPSYYLAYRDIAKKQGAEVFINDSISHAWQYKGGVLDIVTQKQANQKNQYTAWGNEEVVTEKNKLLDIIRDEDIHVISTVRVKEKHEIIDGKPVSLGEQQIQQGDLKYEPDLVLSMVQPGSVSEKGMVTHPVALVTKTRYAIFEKGQQYEFTPELIEQLRLYLEEGEDPAVILQKQKEEYIQAVTDYLNANKSAVAIWNVLKTDAGYPDTKLAELPLSVIKTLYLKITE